MYQEQVALISCRGAGCGITHLTNGPSWISNNSIACFSQSADSRFLYHLFRVTSFQDVITGSAQPQITFRNLAPKLFRIPDLATQKSISKVLKAYDDLIQVNDRRIVLLEKMARGLFEEWFVRFRFPGNETVAITEMPDGPLPANWTLGVLGDFGQVVTGKTPSKLQADLFGLDIPFVKIPDLHGVRYVTKATEMLSSSGAASQNNKTIPIGSLLVSCIGTVGLVAISGTTLQTNQQINSLVPAEGYTLEYLYFSILRARERLQALGSNGATMPNVNKQKFSTLVIQVPPTSLLRSFHEYAAPKFALLSALEIANRRLETARDLLLPRLLSGRLGVGAVERELTEAA
jgi:type I restriction enzyme S subunit